MPFASTSDFQGRHAVVTGGTGALGSAVVGALLDRGASCHIPVLKDSELARFPFRAHPRVRLATGIDLTDERAAKGFFEGVPSLWASIHVAGGFTMAPLVETSLADFRSMMDMNGATCFLSCREAVRRMRATSPEGGRIVNVAAKPALVPVGGMAAYSASKAAVAGLTQSLAEELKGDRIWVNAVVPSIMDTPANRKAMPDADFARWPKVEEVAQTIVFLASPLNQTTRGALAPVYGAS